MVRAFKMLCCLCVERLSEVHGQDLTQRQMKKSQDRDLLIAGSFGTAV